MVCIMAIRRCLALAALIALSSSVAACAAPSAESEEEGGGEEAAVGEDHLEMSNDTDKLVKVPFYFAMPKSSLSGPLERTKYSYSTLWNPSRETGLTDIGLRVIAVPEQGQ